MGTLPDRIKTLSAAEILIRRGAAAADATPFLAHCELDESDKARFLESFREFLDGDTSRILAAFRNWPLTTTWSFASVLSSGYGDNGHAVYRVLNENFGVDISGSIRDEINSAFRRVCRRHGLCYDGSGRWVNDYLAQAGIAHSQLHHVAKAFLFAERAFGPAPPDNTAALNSWEDDARDFLPPGVRIPRMVLEVDESAHYGMLFARYRRRLEARNTFERLFFDKLRKAENAISRGQHSTETIPRPSLIWSGKGLALAIPKLEGRLSLSIAAEERRLRGGQNWPLTTPWPHSVSWRFRDHSHQIPVLVSDRHVLAFDAETGRLIEQIDSAVRADALLDMREAVLVAAIPFTVDGKPAYEVGTGGYAGYCTPGAGAVAIKIAGQTLSLRARPRPRLWIESGSVAKGSKGHLLGIEALIGIEFGDSQDADFDLSLSIGTHTEVVSLPAATSGLHMVYELPSHPESPCELVPVIVELRLRDTDRALVRYKAWLWPGLRGFRDGLVFDSDEVPDNFSVDHSRYITTNQAGKLCLETEIAYETATLAFRPGHELISFSIPRPGIALSYTDIEGFSYPLNIGETLIVMDEDKGGSLTIRCPDRQATLNVRGRAERHAFERTATRVLSLADLLKPAPGDEISIERPRKGRPPILLTRVVPAICPKRFVIACRADSYELTIDMQIDVNAVRLALEDEVGHRTEHDYALTDRPPVSGHSPPWFNARLDADCPQRIRVVVDRQAFPSDLTLASIMVRPSGSETFRPLRSSRGDRYAVALEGHGKFDVEEIGITSDIKKRYMTLNSWLSQCFARECWEQLGERIHPRWRALGNRLLDETGGISGLLFSAHQPPLPGAARSWVPLAHPLEITPSLYGAPPFSFSCLREGVSEGSEHLALLAETAGKSIPEVHEAVGLSPAFLTAFGNFAQALGTRVELIEFDFDLYKKQFVQADVNPDARWFWRLGDELLGPVHYGAVLCRLSDRLYEAGLEVQGANDARIRAVASLARAAAARQAATLPLPMGIEEEYAIVEWAPAFLSGFARASRQGSAEAYLGQLAHDLGRSIPYIAGDASFLIRLAPELLAYYLLLWELTTERTSQ